MSSLRVSSAAHQFDTAIQISDPASIASTPSAGEAPLKALDLYSGVGGWSLGLAMAGIDVVASYERNVAACQTLIKNQGRVIEPRDIRKLRRIDLPNSVDIVVGSPPCTQFSFSNRGGGGDLKDGLTDIGRFLWVVSSLRPKYWVLENVPRVKELLEAHVFGGRGQLRRFRHLFENPEVHIEIVDMSSFGVPQRRLRCIAGRFPWELLKQYREVCQVRTLGDVIRALNKSPPEDPIYRFAMRRADLIDHDSEQPLSAEERRLNRDAKLAHPIYNTMSFPDSLDRPVRAITATCTRVSRESVVIESPNASGIFRRLSLRERACAQGFPITYQFYAETYSRKMALIGNAIPPLFTYYLGCALTGIPPDHLRHPDENAELRRLPDERPSETPPPISVGKFIFKRRFRAAIPSLRFKSGVRFELANHFSGNKIKWRVSFFFGTSKQIRQVRLNSRAAHRMDGLANSLGIHAVVQHAVNGVRRSIDDCSATDLQHRWNRRSEGLGPYALLDAIDEAAKTIASRLEVADASTRLLALRKISRLSNNRKLAGKSSLVLAGLILGSFFNSGLIARTAIETALKADKVSTKD